MHHPEVLLKKPAAVVWTLLTMPARWLFLTVFLIIFWISRNEFGDFVIDNFVDEYLAGRTPNPCVLCNTYIKWEALLKRADKLDCEFIATGHYANIRQQDSGRYVISKGKDENKDQSYVLWGVSQQNLARTKFPLGSFTKAEIRQMAIDMGQEELARKAKATRYVSFLIMITVLFYAIRLKV